MQDRILSIGGGVGWEASRPLTLAASVGDPDTTTNNLDETLLFLSLSLCLS